jgi:hypothetical protein
MAKKNKNIPPPIKQQTEQKKTPAAPPQTRATVSMPSQTSKAKAAEAKATPFIFGRLNYIIMVAGLVLIAIGFILMIGGGSNDPKVFNPALFDAQRLTFSTLFILFGLGAEAVAIMKKPKPQT